MTDAEFSRVLAEIARLADGEPDRASPEGRRLDELAALADEREAGGLAALLEDAERR